MSNNIGAQGCVAQQPSVFDVIPQVPGALTLTLQDRGAEYGDYTHMAQVAQSIKNALRLGEHYHHMGFAQQESLDVIATKLARIVCGNPFNKDSWHDIQGYAKLAEDRCPPPGGAGAPATP